MKNRRSLLFVLLCTVFFERSLLADHQGTFNPAKVVGGGVSAAFVLGITALTGRNRPLDLTPDETKFVEEFCESPSEAVCKTFRVKDLTHHLKNVREEVQKEALDRVAKKYGTKARDQIQVAEDIVSGLIGLGLTAGFGPSLLKGIEEPARNVAIYLKKIEDIATAELKEDVDYSHLFKEVLRPALEKAVAEQPIEVKDRKQIFDDARKAIDQVEFMTPSQYLESGGNLINIRAFCGKDLLSYNSFFFKSNTNSKAPVSVVVCPGVWLTAMAARRCGEYSKSFLMDTLRSTLSHELGHRIDYKRVLARSSTTPYDEFGACIHANIWKEGTLKEFLHDDFNEIVADYWSAETLAQMAATGPSGKSDLIRILRYSSTPYCDSKPNASDPHPPGPFRIDLKGRNPRLRRALGCKPESARKAPICALEGLVKPPPLPLDGMPKTSIK